MPEFPIYLVAGGRDSMKRRGPDPLLREALQASGVERPRVAYVGAASGDNPAFRLMIGAMLKKAGAAAVALAPLCGRRADPEKAREVLRAADVVFMSGGDVGEGMAVLSEKRMSAFFRKLFREGKPFVGVSAGSIMLARAWVRWKDPAVESSAEVFPCLGLAPVLCDTHGEGDSWEELRALLALSPAGSIGYGIVSGSAIVCRSGGKVEARGGEIHRFRRRSTGVAQIESLRPA
ncbi:MAG TPA: Type 1 glutamine amidotransferase-like domain-containing protein [Spirochaetia bacterium]|nr:Type 1 glutamine amidotransferase-like domain-containing protein [Spirochaetia bacterium]